MAKRIAIFRNCTCTRKLLASINILFIIIGIVIISLGVILLKSNVLANLTKSDTINKTFGLPIFIYFGIGLGVFVLIFGIIGLTSSRIDGKKCLKIVYLFLIALIFLAHLIVYIIFTTKTCSIQNQLKTTIKSTADKLNNNATSAASKTVYCELLRSLSILFKCCGANGPYDFNSADLVDNCCDRQEVYRDGCADKAAAKLRKNAKNYVVIPNGVILCFELILALFAFWNLKIFKFQQKKESNSNESSETYESPYKLNSSSKKPRPGPARDEFELYTRKSSFDLNQSRLRATRRR